MKRYLRGHGRMNRKHFAICFITTNVVLYLLFSFAPKNIILYPMLLSIYIQAMCSMQRFHDLNKTGTYVWIFLLIAVLRSLGGVFEMLAGLTSLGYYGALLFLEGTEGPNQYGPDPLEIKLNPDEESETL